MSLTQSLNERILVLDGAMGTAIQNLELSAHDFGGSELEGCNEMLNLTRPDIISSIHESYLKAGCDIIETNTFGATPVVLNEYAQGPASYEINLAAARLARKMADQHSTPEQPRFVAGAIGPTTKAISVTGGITFQELIENFEIQTSGLLEGGVDYLLLETCQDTRNIKAGLIGIEKAFKARNKRVPIAVSATIEPMGTMLGGQSVEALYASLAHQNFLYLGLNCATGPEFMTDHLRSLAKLSHFRLGCVPNAGLPDENGNYLETPSIVSLVMERFLAQGWLNVIGGCCGTHTGHIEALVKLAKRFRPRVPPPKSTHSLLSGIDMLEVTDELRPILVGERTNVIGSKKFKAFISGNAFDEASEMGKTQIRKGAQILDLCLANPDRDEFDDMKNVLEFLTRKVRVPLMIDSTDERVIEMALTYCQGKGIINSINLEDGEERFEKIIPLARKFGAALIVGTIDDDPEQGMGITCERKLAIAERAYELLTQKYHVEPCDIYWDPLVFPCGTGDTQYVGSAAETIRAIKVLKEKFPLTKTVLGISNVSFGLPSAGREVLNSVFLYHCVQAGLDLAIVNSEKLERYPSLSEEDKRLSEDLIFNRNPDAIAAFSNYYRDKKSSPQKNKAELPLEERLAQCIIEGSKEGLLNDLSLALQKYDALSIINGPLMRGMDRVGALFNQNQMIVAEVLQSAEVMKTAVAFLEPHLEKSETSSRGKVVLATVKGDVHDIGKNLVEIIFANNGFQIINLGIKVLPETLIQAIREHKPDIVGLSGLLVKSAQQMALTAQDFEKAGIATPLLVGGAALSRQFVDRQIAPQYSALVTYAKDAMSGLELAKKIVHPDSRSALQEALRQERGKASVPISTTSPDLVPPSSSPIQRSTAVSPAEQVPSPPDFERHILKNTPIEVIWKFINPLMLYGRHLGIRGNVVRQLEQLPSKPQLRAQLAQTHDGSLKTWDAVQDLKQEYRSFFKPQAIYQFSLASGDKNKIHLWINAKDSIPLEFPRQPQGPHLCLSDYVAQEDCIGLFIVSVGAGVREESNKLKEKGEYLKAHALQALAIESAEAYAEYLHAQMRKAWGFPDPTDLTMMERFQAKYRGKRYSFGYPACPNLEDQQVLFKILKPQDIDVSLTDGFMMDPEASVSALVFHHPEATYFSVGPRD